MFSFHFSRYKSKALNTHTHRFIYIYIYIYIYARWNRADALCVYSIFDRFKSSNESFDFWTAMSQKVDVFFPKYYQPQLQPSSGERIMTWQTQWWVIYICIKVRKENEWERKLRKERVLLKIRGRIGGECITGISEVGSCV